MKICVTGASGFIGKELCVQLLKEQYNVVATVRNTKLLSLSEQKNLKIREVANIDINSNWSEIFSGINCVIHCAARVHVMKESEEDALSSYRRVNVDGTRNLAEQAFSAGVKRLIFLSSIKVNGENTNRSCFKHTDIPSPTDAYSISKWEAEQALQKISKQTGLEVVIVRVPLVYGKEVKGNFLHLLNIVAKGIPLPFSKVKNQRSFLGLDNLIAFLIYCIDHPKASGQTFLLSDGEDISTRDLIKKIADNMQKPSRIFSVPIFFLRFLGKVLGKSSEMNRVIDSLQIDSSFTFKFLGWKPATSINEGLYKTVQWYLSR
jgi:nucleoside-diphosphate-sugar epimerase